MKKWIFLSFVLIGASYGLSKGDYYVKTLYKEATQEIVVKSKELADKNKLIERINQSNSIEELKAIQMAEAADIIKLKISMLYLKEAEKYLGIAQKLFKSLKNENHPLVESNYSKALQNYTLAKEYCDKIVESKDEEFNYKFYALKGTIYHRHLELMATRENLTEYINQTITNYKNALKAKNGDIDVTINIELLLKDKQQIMGAAGVKKQQKVKVLNQAGSGNSRGN